MYKIDRKNFGFRLTFSGFIKEDEMNQWVADSKKELDNPPPTFGVFVDMRKLKALPEESQAPMHEGQKAYKEKGMVRSVVIVDSSITRMQFQRIAKETGIYEWERYIDSSSDNDWEMNGIKWIVDGIDPDL